MDEQTILDRIGQLVDEEHRLRGEPGPHDRDRLQSVEELLDQCWDLLRQRRAKREFGDDPDGASVRPLGTVEGYQQ